MLVEYSGQRREGEMNVKKVNQINEMSTVRAKKIYKKKRKEHLKLWNVK